MSRRNFYTRLGLLLLLSAPAVQADAPPVAAEIPDLGPLLRYYGLPAGECQRSALGAVAGGLLGGVIGDRMSEGERTGVVAGSLVGALLGGLIGRQLDAQDAACGAPAGTPSNPPTLSL
jgi:Glycine zipper